MGALATTNGKGAERNIRIAQKICGELDQEFNDEGEILVELHKTSGEGAERYIREYDRLPFQMRSGVRRRRSLGWWENS